jgi:hypothetical protein
MLVDQIKAFKNGIGLGRATAVQIGRALENYEMLTKQELALWTKDLESSREQNGRSQDAGQDEGHANNTESQKEGLAQQSSNEGQAGSGGPGQVEEGKSGREDHAVMLRRPGGTGYLSFSELQAQMSASK